MMTTWEEGDLVEATSANVSAQAGDRGIIVQSRTATFHTVYWPKYKIRAIHSGRALKKLGHLDPPTPEEV
jgi:hypothetical protein